MKFSIRQMMYGMVVAALIAALIGAGANGSPLAYGLGVSACFSVLYFLVFAAIYWSVLFVFGSKAPSPAAMANDKQEGNAS